MSDDRSELSARGEEFLQHFNRGMEFTRELLRENERLRKRLVELEDEQQNAARSPADWEKLRRELLAKIRGLESEHASLRERLIEVESQSRDFADRHASIEEENNNLANLYVASYQLHSTLEVDEVLRIVIEIVINLIGAEAFAIYLLDEERQELRAVAAEGIELARVPACRVGEGRLGRAVSEGAIRTFDDAPGEGRDPERPLVCIPLRIEGQVIGAIGLLGLLQQKQGFSALDQELFNVLAGHAATAIFAARLYSQSERKLSTLQGFIDLLAR
jgi:nitrate/nitrite-specific signal transduction histidine kinase